ncbi:hypothetical protein Metok_0388 [Methanothermococcus okinawensis IH1]|uniref:Uncharacterized protein n=1 Tax=Methanothermococcus okinawensis (strain DSM 14208 / JCM 11175 / IH1) TaxID=647113 RepID=F8AKP2_METOI|nr:hypothetical protein Metok_0388 [Methanothermococcus okinawensis IH1]
MKGAPILIGIFICLVVFCGCVYTIVIMKTEMQ